MSSEEHTTFPNLTQSNSVHAKVVVNAGGIGAGVSAGVGAGVTGAGVGAVVGVGEGANAGTDGNNLNTLL